MGRARAKPIILASSAKAVIGCAEAQSASSLTIKYRDSRAGERSDPAYFENVIPSHNFLYCHLLPNLGIIKIEAGSLRSPALHGLIAPNAQ